MCRVLALVLLLAAPATAAEEVVWQIGRPDGTYREFAIAANYEAYQGRFLNEPPVFSSRNGVLDIMMVAIAQPIPTISFRPPHSTSTIHPTGWVYQICPRPSSGLSCPSGSSTVSPYGGTRLALQQGDVPP